MKTRYKILGKSSKAPRSVVCLLLAPEPPIRLSGLQFVSEAIHRYKPLAKPGAGTHEWNQLGSWLPIMYYCSVSLRQGKLHFIVVQPHHVGESRQTSQRNGLVTVKS